MSENDGVKKEMTFFVPFVVFSVGLNCLPMLLGAMLLPVADVLSSVSSEGVDPISEIIHQSNL